MDKIERIASKMVAEYKYKYDPQHESKPSGTWRRTDSGWSSEDADHHDSVKSTPSAPVEPPADTADDASTVPESEGNGDELQFDLHSPEETEDGEAPAGETPEETESQPSDGGDSESLFDNGTDADGGFVTDEEGKKEEQEQHESGKPAVEEGDGEEQPLFDEALKQSSLDADKYDEHMERMNAFIQKFDNGEGKENDVTFKAIASNLDWSSEEEVRAFAEHCEQKGMDDAKEVIAFLYYQHESDEEKFNRIVDDMK